MKRMFLVLAVLAVSNLACRTSPATPRVLVLYPSATPNATQTPIVQTVVNTRVVQITTTPVPTFTSTPTHPVRQLCVSATETVYLRPSPGTDNYPITQLANGTKVTDLGGQDGNWKFVEVKSQRGWVNEKYLKDCN